MFYNASRKSVRKTRAFLVTLFANHIFTTVLNRQKPKNYYFHDIDLQLVKLKESRRKWNSSFVKLNDAGNVWTAVLWVSRE
jgi:hypothetical protein